MSIKIKFDSAHNPEVPTLILAKKNGDKLGKIDAKSIEVSDSLNDASEISFNVYRYADGEECNLWNQITDFKLVYCVEWDMWFEITVETDESDETIKTVSCTQLGNAELSQIMLYDIEINTEDDIAREEYERPTVLFRTDYPDASLLHRIMDKADHYSVIHVDNTIAKIQRSFSFNDISLYDAFQEIAEEIHCLFVLHSNSDKNGHIQRVISVYDLESNCLDCGHRGEFTGVCPECGSTNINEGYGDDTSIFVTADEIADDIQLSVDTGSVKNCFKLEAGDDLMTATIRNCNPNGTDYLWYISDSVKKDMTKELVDKIESYDKQYLYYQNDYIINLDSNMVAKYNKLVDKYNVYNKDLEKIKTPIKGYPSLMNSYYNTIDLEGYLRSSLMPTVKMSDTTASKEADKLTRDNLSPVSVTSLQYLSLASADNAVLSMAKIVVDSRYRVKVADSSITTGTTERVWTGSFVLTNYSDEEDTAKSNTVSVVVNGDYESFVKQKLDKALAREDTKDLSISGLFKLDGKDFAAELKKYSLNCLKSFNDACKTCIDILIEQGIADNKTWSGKNPNLYENLYMNYLNKLSDIEREMKTRQDEVDFIAGVYYTTGELKTAGVQTYIEKAKGSIQDNLDFQKYIGEDLWHEFCAFRREDKYSNDNYVSDGLNNAELFKTAREFINAASNEIYKSAELQHSISANLKNLLAIEKFSPLVDGFKVGNWLRIMVDGDVYKLRLLEYTIDYDDFDHISVEFSDVDKANSTVNSVQDILSQASSMATSYDTVQRQAEKGSSGKDKLDSWVNDGLSMTNMKIVSNADNQNITWDSHGILCREWLPIQEAYDDRQLKIINRGLYVTDDNWRTSRAGIGNFIFWNPKTKKDEERYGVIADTLVGNLVLSEEVGIYNKNNSMTLDENGFVITLDNDSNKEQTAFTIQKKSTDEMGTEHIDKLLYVDDDGNLTLNGSIKINSVQSDDTSTLSGLVTSAEGVSSFISSTDGRLNKIESSVDGVTQTIQGIDGRVTEFETTIDGFRVDLGNISGDIDSAAKTATNFLEYTSSGLRIGNLTGSYIGANAVLSSTDLKFNYNTANLATFASNYIALGGSSNRSDIYFAGDKSNAKSKIIGGYQGLGMYGQGTIRLSSGAQLAQNVDVASLGSYDGNYADLNLNSDTKHITMNVGSGSSTGDFSNSMLELYGTTAYVRASSDICLIAPKVTAGISGARIDAAGSVCRTMTTNWSLPTSDTVVPFNSTQTIYNPYGIFSVGEGYIKVDCPSNYRTVYVELSANLTADATVDNRNLAVAIMSSTSSSTNPNYLDNVVSTVSGARTIMLHIGIAPVTVAVTSNTYFRIVARMGGGGGGYFSGSQSYRPTFNARIVGAE